MRVSVIATVLNEGESARKLMDSLLVQNRLPDEIIIVDGGSSDNTVEILLEYGDRLPLRLMVEPGLNISQGRNQAIRATGGGIVASTDAGVRLVPCWLDSLVKPFEGDGSKVSVVSGFFLPDPEGLFETALGATVLPMPEDIDPEVFLPSSRSVAFAREAWEAIGGYPSWLDYCEDLIFDLRLRDRYGAFGWAPEAVAFFRPRSSLSSFFRQYFRYARGDGKADLWRRRHAIRYMTYLALMPALLVLGVWRNPAWLLVLPLGALAYCWRPWRRLGKLWDGLGWSQRLLAGLLVPVIRLTGDVAKMIGYPVGWAWRLRNWGRREIHWREGAHSDG